MIRARDCGRRGTERDHNTRPLLILAWGQDDHGPSFRHFRGTDTVGCGVQVEVTQQDCSRSGIKAAN